MKKPFFILFFEGVVIFQLFSKTKREKQLLSVFDSLSEGAVILDWKGDICEVNQKGALFLKGDKQSLLQTHFFDHPHLKEGAFLLETDTGD